MNATDDIRKAACTLAICMLMTAISGCMTEGEPKIYTDKEIEVGARDCLIKAYGEPFEVITGIERIRDGDYPYRVSVLSPDGKVFKAELDDSLSGARDNYQSTIYGDEILGQIEDYLDRTAGIQADSLSLEYACSDKGYGSAYEYMRGGDVKLTATITVDGRDAAGLIYGVVKSFQDNNVSFDIEWLYKGRPVDISHENGEEPLALDDIIERVGQI